MPNNAPPILHSRKNGWTPLFKGRSAAAADMVFPPDAVVRIADRAFKTLQIRGAREYLDDPRGRRWITTMIVLAASESGARTPAAVSARSGLGLDEAATILSVTRIARWTGPSNRLTHLGRGELARLRRRRKSKPVLPSSVSSFYYPTQLRAR